MPPTISSLADVVVSGVLVSMPLDSTSESIFFRFCLQVTPFATQQNRSQIANAGLN